MRHPAGHTSAAQAVVEVVMSAQQASDAMDICPWPAMMTAP